MNSEILRDNFGPGMRTALPSRARLGKKLVHLMSMSRICEASSVSLYIDVPLAIKHHFSCGICWRERQPSMPMAQQRVFGVRDFWAHKSFNCNELEVIKEHFGRAYLVPLKMIRDRNVLVFHHRLCCNTNLFLRNAADWDRLRSHSFWCSALLGHDVSELKLLGLQGSLHGRSVAYNWICSTPDT